METSNVTDISSISIPMETNFTRQIKFIVLTCLEVPSIVCYLILFHHHVFNRAVRQALHNHAILELLTVGAITVLVDVPMILNYLRIGQVIPKVATFCLIWNFIDLLLYALIAVVMLWTSLERHILIFHRQLHNTHRKRILFHYAPLIILPSYLIFFYSTIAFLHPCHNNFDYGQVVGGGLCYLSDTPWLGALDQLAHNVIPAVVTVFSDLALLGRVVWQKHHHMRQPIQWRRHRKMIKQLFCLSALYLCGVVPFGLLACVHMFGGWLDVGLDIQQLYFFYLFYLIALLLPFVCLICTPEIYSKLLRRRQRRVEPLVQRDTRIFETTRLPGLVRKTRVS